MRLQKTILFDTATVRFTWPEGWINSVHCFANSGTNKA